MQLNSNRRARVLLPGLVALCLLVIHSGCGSPDKAEETAKTDDSPNVLLVTVDTLRADYLGCYGFAADTSPNVDRLARQGVLFERAIAASTLTAPSHASIMTSRYLREHSIGHGNGSTRLSDETSLAMLFKAAGYETAAFVGNINLARSTGLGRGFEVYDDQLPQVEGARGEVFERTAEHTSKRALSWLAKP